jgi:hypothetical protein
MHWIVGAVAVATALPVIAQSPGDRPLPGQAAPAAKPKPAAAAPAPDRKLQPIPEPPPPPTGFELDAALEPQVTIQRRGTDQIEEFRIRGRLYMVKVTPAHGVPYYLIDEGGRGDFTRRDSYDTGTRPPMWVIHTW